MNEAITMGYPTRFQAVKEAITVGSSTRLQAVDGGITVSYSTRLQAGNEAITVVYFTRLRQRMELPVFAGVAGSMISEISLPSHSSNARQTERQTRELYTMHTYIYLFDYCCICTSLFRIDHQLHE